MSEPVFVEVSPEICGSIITSPSGGYLLSAYHAPTNRTLFGNELTIGHAYDWLDGTRLVFAEPEGVA